MIFDMDTQNDYMCDSHHPEFVEGSYEIKDNLIEILQYGIRNDILVTGTVNLHAVHDGFGDKLSDTVLVDSELFYNVPNLRHGIDTDLAKDCYQIYFERSAPNIWAVDGSQPDNLMTLIRSENVNRVFIIGVDKENSMIDAINGFLSNGLNVTVVSDAVAGDIVDVLMLEHMNLNFVTTETFLAQG